MDPYMGMSKHQEREWHLWGTHCLGRLKNVNNRRYIYIYVSNISQVILEHPVRTEPEIANCVKWDCLSENVDEFQKLVHNVSPTKHARMLLSKCHNLPSDIAMLLSFMAKFVVARLSK